MLLYCMLCTIMLWYVTTLPHFPTVEQVLSHLLKCDSTESMENALGLGKSEAVTGRKKNIVTVYLQDQNLKINIIKRALTPQQKSVLKAELSKIIEKRRKTPSFRWGI